VVTIPSLSDSVSSLELYDSSQESDDHPMGVSSEGGRGPGNKGGEGQSG